MCATHHRGVHLCSRVGKSWSPCPEQDVVRRAANRVGHRAIESDRSHRAVGMPGSHFTIPSRLLPGVESGRTGLAGKVCCLLDRCPRQAGAAPRERSSHDLERSWTLQAWRGGGTPVPPCFAVTLRRGSERCREAPLERRARREVVAAAPDQLRWKSILVNHVKYDAARVTGTVSGTSRQ